MEWLGIFSGKNKKSINNLSSAEIVQGVQVTVNTVLCFCVITADYQIHKKVIVTAYVHARCLIRTFDMLTQTLNTIEYSTEKEKDLD